MCRARRRVSSSSIPTLGGTRIEGPGLVHGFSPTSQPASPLSTWRWANSRCSPAINSSRNSKAASHQNAGWTRDMIWTDTGHDWVPTSPHVPTPDACFAYAATGILGELYVINIGVGYTLPFEMIDAMDQHRPCDARARRNVPPPDAFQTVLQHLQRRKLPRLPNALARSKTSERHRADQPGRSLILKPRSPLFR